MEKGISSSLTIAALKDAISQRNTDDLIHHLRSGVSVLQPKLCKNIKG